MFQLWVLAAKDNYEALLMTYTYKPGSVEELLIRVTHQKKHSNLSKLLLAPPKVKATGSAAARWDPLENIQMAVFVRVDLS